MLAYLDPTLFAFYVLLGPTVWGLFGAALFLGRHRMLLLKRPYRLLPWPPPKVSILIPAKDEGERITDCLRSALRQDYPDFEVIAINDRSTDRTGELMDELAAAVGRQGRPPHLKVVHIHEGELPPGWTGKCNALHTAVKQARGDWLLFVDSDVVLAPDALSTTIARAERRKYDLLSLLPRLESHTLAESLLVPLAGAAVSVMYLVSMTNRDSAPGNAFANGQYLFIRRSAYDAIGGHESVRDRFCEDVELARRAKRSGQKVRISWGADFAAVRMYSSLLSIFRGWGRNFFAASLGRPWRIFAAILFVILCSFSAYAAVGWGGYRLAGAGGRIMAVAWLVAGIFHLGLITAFLGIMYTWSGNRWHNALLFPAGGMLLLGIFARSLRMCITGKVEWRGTHYTHRMDPALTAPAAGRGQEQT